MRVLAQIFATLHTNGAVTERCAFGGAGNDADMLGQHRTRTGFSDPRAHGRMPRNQPIHAGTATSILISGASTFPLVRTYRGGGRCFRTGNSTAAYKRIFKDPMLQTLIILHWLQPAARSVDAPVCRSARRNPPDCVDIPVQLAEHRFSRDRPPLRSDPMKFDVHSMLKVPFSTRRPSIEPPSRAP